LARASFGAAERKGLIMRLTVVGSGDAFGSGGRFNTCFHIAGERCVLLDCGASTPVALRSRKIDPNGIDAIILTHLHGDHFGGLPFLLLDGQFLSRRERPLVIAGPPGTEERLRSALEVFFPRSSGSNWRFPWEVVEITPGRPSELLGLGIATTEVVHQSGAPSTAVRMTDGKTVLAYSGDTEWTPALVEVADGANLFIIECYDYARALSGHMSFAILKERKSDLRARSIMITHMNPTMLDKIDEARSLGFLVAEDGLTVEI
jgi:ribonuclease BN (tRNA processing enzyme)